MTTHTKKKTEKGYSGSGFLLLSCFAFKILIITVRGHHAPPMGTWWSEDKFVVVSCVCLPLSRIQGLNLDCHGWYGKCLCPLSHLACPACLLKTGSHSVAKLDIKAVWARLGLNTRSSCLLVFRFQGCATKFGSREGFLLIECEPELSIRSVCKTLEISLMKGNGLGTKVLRVTDS